MAAGPRDEDPIDKDPRERGLERRSGGGSVSIWLIVGLILMAAAAIYVISAL